MKRKKTIAFLMGKVSETGGISRVTSILTKSLVKTEQYHVHIIGYHPKTEKKGYDWHERIDFHDLLDKPKNMQSGILQACKKLKTILRNNQIDVLIICGHNVGLLGILGARRLNIPLLYWPHSSFKGYNVRFKQFNEQISSYFAKTVITLTKADQKTFFEKTRAKKVVQIYNPIDPLLSKTTISYNPDTKKIISVGRLAKSKNFDTYALEVAKEVFKKHPEYTWNIYGSGELESEIKENIQSMGLSGKVNLMGHAKNIYDIYPKHSILVMTSSFEGFPMSLLEGMANRLPLVGFDVPTGPNEIIKSGRNGFLIKPFDVKNMANMISKLINSRELRNEFSKSNLQLLKEFQIDTITSRWIELFEELSPTTNS